MDTDVLNEQEEVGERHGRFYTVFIDDVEYHFDHTPVTGRELMDTAGIPYTTGLVLILEDGSQQQVGLDEAFDLRPGRRFKKAPRFKRG